MFTFRNIALRLEAEIFEAKRLLRPSELAREDVRRDAFVEDHQAILFGARPKVAAGVDHAAFPPAAKKSATLTFSLSARAPSRMAW